MKTKNWPFRSQINKCEARGKVTVFLNSLITPCPTKTCQTAACRPYNLKAAFFTPSLSSLSFLSILPPLPLPPLFFFFLKWHEGWDGWSPRSSRLRPHRWGEIKVLCELLTVLPFSTQVEGTWGGGGGGSHLRPWHHRLITYHVSPAAPRQAQRDRFHLSSLRGSQYNLLCWSDIQRRGVELPNLILQMRTLSFLPSHVLVCRCNGGSGVGISDLAVIWKRHHGLSGSCGFHFSANSFKSTSRSLCSRETSHWLRMLKIFQKCHIFARKSSDIQNVYGVQHEGGEQRLHPNVLLSPFPDASVCDYNGITL